MRWTSMLEDSNSNLASYLCWNMYLGNSDWLPCWLSKVSHQRCFLVNKYHVCLCQVRIRLPTLDLKPEEMSPEVENSSSTKRTCVHQITSYSMRQQSLILTSNVRSFCCSIIFTNFIDTSTMLDTIKIISLLRYY